MWKKKLEKSLENISFFLKKSCWGCFGDIFGPSKGPKKVYRGGYDQKKKSQNENPQRWIDSQLNSASFKTDFKLNGQKQI